MLRFSKLLAALLAVAMVVTCAPLPAFSAATPAAGLGSAVARTDNPSGVAAVYSLSELNAVLAAHSLPYGADESVNVKVILAEGFRYDETSTTPFAIQLPVGGGEHPQVHIDLNGHRIQNRAIHTIELLFGNPAGTCALGGASSDDPGYYNAANGCPGVAHDYDIWLTNGFVTTDYDGCDASPTSPCGRKGVVTVGTEFLWGTSEGSNYGGRVHFIDLKVGGDSGSVQFTAAPSYNLIGDACFSVGVPVTEIEITGGQGDCENGLEIQADQYDGSDGQQRVNFDWSYALQGNYAGSSPTSCTACNGGLLNVKPSSPNSEYYGLVRLFGPLGNTRGGNFLLDAQGYHLGSLGAASGQCYHTNQSSESFFLDNGADPADILSGEIRFSGTMCTRGWLRSSAVSGLLMSGVLSEQVIGGVTFGLPGFLESDTTTSGHTKFPVLDSSASGEIGGALFRFAIDPRPDTADIVYSQLLDADILTGSALRDLDPLAYAWVDLGLDGHYGVISATVPTAYETKDGTSSGGGGPGGSDPDAIHDNVAGEIAALTLKAVPAAGDHILIEDSAAANAKRRISVSSLGGGSPTWGSITPSGTLPGGFYAVGAGAQIVPISPTTTIMATALLSGTSLALDAGEHAVDMDGNGTTFTDPVLMANHFSSLWYLPFFSALPADVDGLVATYDAATDSIGWELPAASPIVASGVEPLATASIASGACSTADTGIAASGVLASDTLAWSPNADISVVTGYTPVSTGALVIYAYPTAGAVNFKVCNPTASSITPGAVTLNWKVLR